MKSKIHAITAMRTLSILAVLGIHTTTKVLETSQYNLITYWPTLLLNQIGRFAVPLFFLISGFVLELNYAESIDYKTYLKKRFGKIFVPYIFWSLIYYYFVYTKNPNSLLTAFVTGNASYQLYFIPTICIFYLLFPLLHKFYKLFANLPVLAVLTYLQIQLMNKDYLIRQFDYVDPVRILILAYLYFIVGMIAARNKDVILRFTSKLKYLLIPMALFFIRHIYYEGRDRYYVTYNIGSFYSQWRPDILIYTLILSVLFFYYFRESNFFSNLLSRASRLSYLVFFIHVIILEQVWRYGGFFIFTKINQSPAQIFMFDLIYFLSVGIISFGAAYLIHKVPGLSRVTG